MAEKEKPDTRPTKGAPLGPGEPDEQPALSVMGATFAERAKANKQWAEKRQVKSGDTEDKAIRSSSTSSKRK